MQSSTATQATETGTTPDSNSIYQFAASFTTQHQKKTNSQQEPLISGEMLKVMLSAHKANIVNATVNVGSRADESFYKWANEYLKSLDR